MSFSVSGLRWVASDPVWPGRCGHSRSLIEPKVRSTTALACGRSGGAGWRLMPGVSQAAVNAVERKTLPRSTTIVSGRTTGLAAAPARRCLSGAGCSWGGGGVVHAQDVGPGGVGGVGDGYLCR